MDQPQVENANALQPPRPVLPGDTTIFLNLFKKHLQIQARVDPSVNDQGVIEPLPVPGSSAAKSILDQIITILSRWQSIHQIVNPSPSPLNQTWDISAAWAPVSVNNPVTLQNSVVNGHNIGTALAKTAFQYENPVLLVEVRRYFDKMAAAIEQEVNCLDRIHTHEYNEFGEVGWLHAQRMDWHFFVGARDVIDEALKHWRAKREEEMKTPRAAQAIVRAEAAIPPSPVTMAAPQAPMSAAILQTPMTPFSAATPTPTLPRTVGIAGIVANELGQYVQERNGSGTNVQSRLRQYIQQQGGGVASKVLGKPGQCAKQQGGAEIYDASRPLVPQADIPLASGLLETLNLCE